MVLMRLSMTVMLGLALPAFPQGESRQALDLVLQRMESIGKVFQSFQADFTQRKYTAVLDEFDAPEAGLFVYARAKDGTALLRQEIKIPAPRILTIKGGVVTVYQPRLQQATIANLGKDRDKAEYLALGIGQSPARLKETFDISYQGIEPVDGSKCSVLMLKPKSKSAAAYFSSITLWIKDANNLPVQQKLQEPNRDYLLVKFSAEKLNPKVSDSQFEQKLPKGVEIQTIR